MCHFVSSVCAILVCLDFPWLFFDSTWIRFSKKWFISSFFQLMFLYVVLNQVEIKMDSLQTTHLDICVGF